MRAPHSQAVAAAEAYIRAHSLEDVQVEVETRTLDELQQVRVCCALACHGWLPLLVLSRAEAVGAHNTHAHWLNLTATRLRCPDLTAATAPDSCWPWWALAPRRTSHA